MHQRQVPKAVAEAPEETRPRVMPLSYPQQSTLGE